MRQRNSRLTETPMFGFLPHSELEQNLRSLNPWWGAKPGPLLPIYRRWLYKRVQYLLHNGIAPAIVIRGPRRVGKTVAIRQLIEGLLSEKVDARRILYVPFDELPSLRGIAEPVLAIARWYENQILGASFNEGARAGRQAYLFFDEVQNLKSWAPQIKNLVDNHSVHVVVTGSSSLRIEAGRDSLAGRISTLDLGSLFLREIAEMRTGSSVPAFWKDSDVDRLPTMEFWKSAVSHATQHKLARKQAFAAFSERGSYPVAHDKPDVPWHELAGHLNETVIQRALQHDLRMGARGQKRDEQLLEEVFRLSCRYAGQYPGQRVFVPEIAQALAANVGWQRILAYLKFLDGTLLIRLIQPMEIRLKRRKSPSKISLCDHSLRASWLQEVVPLDPNGLANNIHLADLAGHLAESVLGYFLMSIPNLDVAHFPPRGAEPEVDFIITIGTRRIPIEVKYRHRIDPHQDTTGLRAFLEKTVYNAPFGLLVTLEDDVVVNDPRIIPISLSSLLWLR